MQFMKPKRMQYRGRMAHLCPHRLVNWAITNMVTTEAARARIMDCTRPAGLAGWPTSYTDQARLPQAGLCMLLRRPGAAREQGYRCRRPVARWPWGPA